MPKENEIKQQEPGAEGSGSVVAPAKPSAGFATPAARYFFAAFAVFILAVFLLLMKPFLTYIFLAFVLFVLFSPVYDFIARRLRGRKTVSSIITCLLIIIIIFLPFLIFTGVLATSAYNFYQHLDESFKSGTVQQLLNFKDSPLVLKIVKYIPAVGNYDFNAGDIIGKYLGTVSQFIYTNAKSIVTGVSSIMVDSFLSCS
jgi:predicted PurR-regulated permease PerM